MFDEFLRHRFAINGFKYRQSHLGSLRWKRRNELLNMGALNFGEIKFAYRFLDVAAIHRAIGNQRLMTDRKIADCLGRELIEFQCFLVVQVGKEVTALV